MMTSIQNGSGNYSVQLTPIEARKQSQQELMQVARAAAEQVQERAHQRVGRHRHLRRVERAAAARGGGGGGTNRLSMIVQGPDIEQLQKPTPARCWRRSRRSTA